MTIARLRKNTRGGDFAYYGDIAAFMAGVAPAHLSGTPWVDGEPATRERWRDLVTARHHLGTSQRPQIPDALASQPG
jgi:hypothetical protein